MPETFFTVWHNVFERGGLQPGETLLVHGGSSGIGTTAIQLAMPSAPCVIATAGSEEKCDACRRLGADLADQLPREDFVAAVKEATGGSGADVDPRHGRRRLRRAQLRGCRRRRPHRPDRHAEAAPSPATDFAKLMVKRLTHTGSTLRPRTVEFKAEVAAALEREVWPLLAPGGSRR